MSTEANKALVRRFYDQVTNGRNLAALDELLAPNFEGFKVEGTEHWHIHSLISVIKGVRFERGPGGIAGPGTEILSIHLLDAGSTPLLSFILTDRYDAQGRPIPQRFARYDELAGNWSPL